MSPDEHFELFTEDLLKKLMPPEKTDQFFEALFGDADEGAYEISLAYKGGTTQKFEFEFHLTPKPGKCLACNLTYGLPARCTWKWPRRFRKESRPGGPCFGLPLKGRAPNLPSGPHALQQVCRLVCARNPHPGPARRPGLTAPAPHASGHTGNNPEKTSTGPYQNSQFFIIVIPQLMPLELNG